MNTEVDMIAAALKERAEHLQEIADLKGKVTKLEQELKTCKDLKASTYTITELDIRIGCDDCCDIECTVGLRIVPGGTNTYYSIAYEMAVEIRKFILNSMDKNKNEYSVIKGKFIIKEECGENILLVPDSLHISSNNEDYY